MKKSLLSAGILTLASLITLVGCGSDDSRKDDPLFAAQVEEGLEQPFARVVFNPASGNLNLPNDFLMIPSGNFFDFTLNTEGDEAFDGKNPQHALSALDGWSTQHPFAIRVTLPEGMDIDATTVGASSIRLFEATQALEGDSVVCQTLAAAFTAPGVPCELGDELQYGQDFIASYTAGSGSISVVLLSPLKAAQGHMLAVTEELKSTDGRAVKGSIIWELARQNITTNPLGSDDLLQLQGVVNSLVNVLAPAGLETSDLSYAAYFSTQSINDVVNTVKKINIGSYAQAYASVFEQTLVGGGDAATADANARVFASQFLPNISAELPDTASNSFEAIAPFILPADTLNELTAIGLNTCDGLLGAVAAGSTSPLFETALSTLVVAGPHCATSIVSGEVNLPYYLSPTEPLTQWWKAACTSGATLQSLGEEIVGGLLAAGQVGANNDYCQLVSEGQLYDLNLTSLGLDDPRNLTKVSPIPMARGRNTDDQTTLYNEAGTESVPVHFTVPDENVIAALSVATGGAIPMVTKPENGWPVVVFQHGITGSKNNVLGFAATLSLAGFASVAIDHPLHGDRGFVLADGTFINASSSSVTEYLNFESLLTGRDNPRQSIADIVALRLALNAINDSTGLLDLDVSEVHFMAHSLGSVTGATAVAVANETLGGELSAFDDMYAFSSAVLGVPAGGVPTSILESANFGPLVKGTLLSQSSEDFADFLTGYMSTNELSFNDAISPAFLAFESLLTDEQAVEVDAILAAFGFAAQTVLDSADPVNSAVSLGETTPVLVHLIVGGGINDDGSLALTDQVNPVVTSLPLAGGLPLANLMGLPPVSNTTTEGGGVVKLIVGDHFSFFSPQSSAIAMEALHAESAAFFINKGQGVTVFDPSIVAQ